MTLSPRFFVSAQKPWYMCLNMFIGMAGCLLPSLVAALVVAVRRAGASRSSLREPLLTGDASAADSAAPAGATAADSDARRPVKGLRGLMVVGAPTVRRLPLLSRVTLAYALTPCAPCRWLTCWPPR